MIGEILKPGDEVLIRIEADSREWGYNPCPDDTKAVVIGPTESIWGRVNNCSRKPGVYPNHAHIEVRLETGEIMVMSSHRLHFPDAAEEERRLIEFRAMRIKDDTWEGRSAEWLRDLPETPFYEWDHVEWEGTPYVVRAIRYDETNGENYYSVSRNLESGGTYDVAERSLTLLSRGKIWRYFNNESVEFDGIGEEEYFFRSLELYECVRNPRTGHYGWGGVPDCVSAIAAGVAHSYTTGISPYGIRFLDEKLGERVSKAILSGYRPSR